MAVISRAVQLSFLNPTVPPIPAAAPVDETTVATSLVFDRFDVDKNNLLTLEEMNAYNRCASRCLVSLRFYVLS